MTLGLSTTLRNARLDAITTAVGTSGLIKVYDGTRPSTGGTATTLLGTLTCSSAFAPAASGGVLTANAIAQDSDADATSTATWARLTTSGGTFVLDMSVTATGGGGDLQLPTTSIVQHAAIQVSSCVLTEGNA